MLSALHKFIFFTFIILSLSQPVYSSTYVPVEDNMFYTLLARLEAEGVITTGLLDTKPISRKEAFRLLREAEANGQAKSTFIRDIVRSLKDRLGPEPSETEIKALDALYGRYLHTDARLRTLRFGPSGQNHQTFNYNNNGDLYQRGSSGRAGFSSRIENGGPLSIALNPEFRHPETQITEDRLVLKKGYAVVDLWGWDAVFGKDSQWWGPGYHGSLLLSNNAEPFSMFKFANSTPVRLPWIFESLGPFGFIFFVTNLEKGRPIPEPYLYGMRFDFKPHPNIEIGLQKTALLGGRKGRKEDLSTWVDSLLPFSDTENRPGRDPGDQRAGLTFKVTIPWSVQPFQMYMDANGEDEYRNLPNLWAFIFGVYLPRIANAGHFDLRIEYATTRGRHDTPYYWYTHGQYTSYTYKGSVIGHHVGTAANDYFVETSYLMPEKNARLFLSFDREEHNVYVTGSNETLNAVSAGTTMSLTRSLDITAQYSYGRLRNQGNLPGPILHPSALEGSIKYSF